MIRKTICMISFGLCLAIILSACGNHGNLKVGMDYSIKPLGFVEEGQRKGFETDLWDAIAREAGFTYEIEPMAAGEILQSIQDGKIDAGLAGLTIKGDRKKKFDFGISYYDAGQVVLVAENNKDVKSALDLKDKVVATRLGTSGYDYASKIKGVKEVRGFPDISEAYRELTLRKVDAVIFDSPNVYDYVQTKGQGKAKTVGILLTNEQYGIVLEKGSKYKGRINNALRELGRNGTYEEIYVKWFGNKPKTSPGDQ
jgi:glutamine transport system substrate-binding protein